MRQFGVMEGMFLIQQLLDCSRGEPRIRNAKAADSVPTPDNLDPHKFWFDLVLYMLKCCLILRGTLLIPLVYVGEVADTRLLEDTDGGNQASQGAHRVGPSREAEQENFIR